MVLFIPSAEKKPYQIHPEVEIFNAKINKKKLGEMVHYKRE